MNEAALPETASDGLAATPGDTAVALYTREFWLVFSAHFALNASANLFVLFPVFIQRLGGSAQQIGAVVGTFFMASLVARPIFGRAIDSYGRRTVALRCLILDIVAVSLYLPLGALGWPIFAVRMLHGASEGVARVALFAMVYDILPEGRRGEGMATFSLCGMLPGAVAPLLGEELIKRYGFHGFFAAGIALCIIAALATFRLPDDRPTHVPHGAQRESGKPRYSVLLRADALLPLWIVTLLFALAISSRLSFVAPFAYAQGITRVAWYFLIYSGIAVVLRLFSGRLIDQLGLERMVVPSSIVLASGLAILALAGKPGMLIVAALVGGIGHGYLYPVLSALVIGRTPANAMAGSSTIYTSLYDTGAMAGPYILGMVANGMGYAAMFYIAGATMLAAAIYFATADDRSATNSL